jgi:hypothetical protein
MKCSMKIMAEDDCALPYQMGKYNDWQLQEECMMINASTITEITRVKLDINGRTCSITEVF